MYESNKTRTVSYFSEQIALQKALAQQLEADDRSDEAVFAKIRLNIFDIFSTVFSAACKTIGQDQEKTIQFFLTKLRQIPQSWQNALITAQTHGESEKAHIEQLKLDTAAEIQKTFEQIWGVHP